MARPRPRPRPRPLAQPELREISLSQLLGILLTPFYILFAMLYILYLAGCVMFRLSRAILRKPPTREEFKRLERERDRKHAHILAWTQQPGRTGDRHRTKDQAVQTKLSHSVQPLLKRRMTN